MLVMDTELRIAIEVPSLQDPRRRLTGESTGIPLSGQQMLTELPLAAALCRSLPSHSLFLRLSGRSWGSADLCVQEFFCADANTVEDVSGDLLFLVAEVFHEARGGRGHRGSCRGQLDVAEVRHSIVVVDEVCGSKLVEYLVDDDLFDFERISDGDSPRRFRRGSVRRHRVEDNPSPI